MHGIHTPAAPCDDRGVRPVPVILLVAACSRPAVFIPVPRDGDPRAAVVGIHRAGEIDAWAVDLGGAVTVEAEVGEPSLIEAVLYARTLDDLKIRPGAIENTDDRGLIPTGRAFSGTVDGSVFSGWAESPASAEILALRAVERSCARFETARMTLPSSADLSFAFPVGPASALVGTSDGSVFRVDPGEIRPVRRPDRLPKGPAFIDASNEIWFTGIDERIWRGTLSGTEITAAPASTSSITGEVRHVDGQRTATELGIFTLTRQGSVGRFDGTGVVETQVYSGAVNEGGVVALDPRRAVVAFALDLGIVRMEDDRIIDETPSWLESAILGMSRVAQSGIVAGSSNGVVLTRDAAGTWRQLDSSPITLDLYTFAGTEHGFLEGAALGLLAEYSDGGWCRELQVGSGSIRWILPFAGGWLLPQDAARQEERATLSILTPM
jgi:hypothetical protein